jgi:DNA-binding response OmpR family regulator
MSRALIIEDDWLVAFSIEEALRTLGYSVFKIVDSVKAAIEAAQKHRPDLIIADHQIADGTGTEAVLAICSDQSIPVVWVTASGPEVRKQVADAVIVDKPFHLTGLIAALSSAKERPFRKAPRTACS